MLDGGPCRVGIESTIVAWEGTNPSFCVGRDFARADRRRAGQAARVTRGGTRRDCAGHARAPLLPGSSLDHFPWSRAPAPSGRVGLILLAPRRVPPGYATVELLSSSGDLGEVARNLFAALRRIDRASLDCALAELAPNAGLGLAINDRLSRAAAAAAGPE